MTPSLAKPNSGSLFVFHKVAYHEGEVTNGSVTISTWKLFYFAKLNFLFFINPIILNPFFAIRLAAA